MIACSVTDIGKHRKVNQDFIFYSLEPVGNLPNLFITADGMGGHQAGDFASRFTVEHIVSWIGSSAEENPIRLMDGAIQTINKQLIQEALADPSLYGMGTTIVMACAVGGLLYVANVGDSRLYTLGENFDQITKDHSLVEEMVANGEMSRDSEGYQEKKNIITRAIGGALDVTADFFEIDIRDTKYILLCSDGLTNMVPDTRIEEIIRETKDFESKAYALVEEANARGGRDNIAVLLIENGVSEVSIC